jgi:hypothetical protein
MAEASSYDTVADFAKPFSELLPQSAEEDRLRLRAYDTYSDLYGNDPKLFEPVMSVDSDNELFRRLSPVARSIVEATNRYLCRDMEWIGTQVDPGTGLEPGQGSTATGAGTGETVALAMAQFKRLFDREEFGAKFLSLKRWMLVRGDAMLHLTADPSKAEGTKISITELEPGSYFAIPDPTNAERVLGCYIVNVIKDDDNEEIVARLEYQRIMTPERAAELPGATQGGVYTRLTFWEKDGWDERNLDESDLKPVDAPDRFAGPSYAALLAGQMLPTEIQAIPVYHFRNKRRGGKLYGLSELQGLETLLVGVNQTITDEELAVALQGLGMYWTDSGNVKDDNGNDVDWVISPASVAQVEEGKQFGRVQGINTVNPSQEHTNLLKREMQETSATPRIAMGGMDAANPASGVALSIEMAPIVAKNEEKEEEIAAKLLQMSYDLATGWLPVYEGIADTGVRLAPTFSDPIPVNREAVLKEIIDLVTAKIISTAYARVLIKERLGYQVPTDEDAALAGEAQATADLAGARMDAEVDAGAEPGGGIL